MDTLAERFDDVLVEEDWAFWQQKSAQHAAAAFCDVNSCSGPPCTGSHTVIGLQRLNWTSRRVVDCVLFFPAIFRLHRVQSSSVRRDSLLYTALLFPDPHCDASARTIQCFWLFRPTPVLLRLKIVLCPSTVFSWYALTNLRSRQPAHVNYGLKNTGNQLITLCNDNENWHRNRLYPVLSNCNHFFRYSNDIN